MIRMIVQKLQQKYESVKRYSTTPQILSSNAHDFNKINKGRPRTALFELIIT